MAYIFFTFYWYAAYISDEVAVILRPKIMKTNTKVVEVSSIHNGNSHGQKKKGHHQNGKATAL
jgi:hypothetical protein